ncbi:MAG: isocitrate lyase/phosphoenolpyruvate mutase family protein [Rhodobiaceae bacterium]|nr:isocitrate lyase/phosphoenolpyruvate mutase family protein [Rhodobiaceae bacterium]MCC0014399.1 isocitrate lyase/phosphoenolpyruvate mutase family protein [Rhodobiaceae bacterium]MCC0050967.1 isocitrate lyase/phosphoenolpyruvate mutase family protein [Rhodobiaceae bacterium]MCC0060327.1 isocitrate lyase/phosphoenolpyruvate mutase family protein [Rhodobiaceae bacterium]
MPADRAACQTFMDLHLQDGLFVMPNPWDIGTARILTTMGFKALASASWALAFTQGVRDGEMAVSRETAIDHASLIREASGLPVNGDFENGFGHDPIDVRETVLDAIDAGLAGCSIEDSTGDNKEPLYEEGLAIERIVAARTAIQETGVPFVLTARCEAFLFDVEQPFKFALERLRKFVEAGADVIYAPGITDAHEIATLVREGGAAVNVLGGVGRHPLGLVELESLGVKRVSIGPQLIRAALGGFMRAAAEIRDKGTFSFVSTNATSADINPFLASSADRKS